MRNRTPWLLVCMLSGLLAPECAVADEDFTVVVNPRTGATYLRNDTATAANIDGYLLVSQSNVFNTTSWSGLTENATPGWSQGQATQKILSEVNLTSALSLPGHGTVPLGLPYNSLAPTKIGEPEPEFEFTISLDGAGVLTGDLEFEMDNNLVLVVNPTTGAATLENQSPFNVNISSYVIQSESGVLDPAGWTSLETSLGAPGGWTSSTGLATRIAEVNVFGSSFVAANGGTLPLGTPIDPELLDDETDLILQFSTAATPGPGDGILGGVVFEAGAVVQLPGDFNGNGTVELGDFNLVVANWGDAVPPNPGPWTGDPPTAPQVDLDDFNKVVANWGDTAAGTSLVLGTNVPEPASLASAAILLATLALWPNRLRKRSAISLSR